MSTFFFALLFAMPAAGGPDWDALVPRTREILAKLIAIDTVNPPGNEIVAANWVKDELARAAIPADVLSPDGLRGSVVARLKGNGSKRPVLVLAHLDVVGFTRASWKSDPLALTERDGFLYGRGVADDKGMAAFALSAFIELARARLPLDRDVILALTADEESGGDHGIRWLLKNHRDKIDAEFALNEGGQVGLETVGVQTTEKLYVDVEIVAQGKSGHSSVPVYDNAIYRIASAVAHIADYEFPMRLNPTTRAHFRALAVTQKGADAEALMKLGAPGDEGARAAVRVSRKAGWNALLRTTCVATLVSGGIRVNALPSEARANVNCRIMPDEDPADVVKALKRAVNDPTLKWHHKLPDRAPLSPVDGPAMGSIRRAASKVWAMSTVVPFMSAGATDSRWLRTAGIHGYGVMPCAAPPGMSFRAHGHDERLPVKALVEGPKFIYEFLVDAAVKR